MGDQDRDIRSSPFDQAHPSNPPTIFRRAYGGFQQLREHTIDLCTDWWLIEVLCLALSAVCLVATVGLLASYDGKPLPRSQPLGLSLNAYLSILCALLKLALAIPLEEALGSQKYLWFSTKGAERSLMDFERFDDAARGPFGAMRLLMRTRVRSFASIGGLVFILSLALDPIFQQLVSLPTLPSLEDQSTIPRVVRYAATRIIINNGSEEIGYNGAMDTAIQTFFHGMHNFEPANTSYYCPNNQCTWPDFETLGICSQCEDIAGELEFGCASEPGEWRREYRDVLNNLRPPDLNRTSCGWFFNLTSSEPMLMSGHSITTNEADLGDDFLVMRILNMRDPLTNALYWNGTMTFPDIYAPITNFAIVNARTREAVFENQRPDAYNCVMQWCTQKIQASFGEGFLSERVSSEFTNRSALPDPYVVTVEEDSLDFNYTHDVVVQSPSTKEVFSVSNNSAMSTRFTMDNWFPAFLTGANDSDTQWLRYWNAWPMSRLGIRSASAASWITNGHIPDTFDDIANAMTRVLRNSRDNSKLVLGSGSPQIFVQVMWPWLVFPSAVLLLSAVFLTVTIRQMTSQQRVWKSSSLTILVHGLSWDARYAFRNARSMRDIRDISSQLPVFLNAEKEGGTLDANIEHETSGSWDKKLIARYFKSI